MAAAHPGAGEREAAEAVAGFVVELGNFSGPFDVLLALIGKRRLDITEVALAEVTDEFIAYVGTLRDRGAASLAELSHFLLVAATLLDLKTARLLPRGEVDDELDLELLEARDLLFARLLQYRAYKGVSAVLGAAMRQAARRTPRAVPLPPEFHDILPPLDFTTSPQALAALFAAIISRDRTPPSVALDHLHLPQVSVAEQRARIVALLESHGGAAEFAQLTADAESGLVVVARFLALLELFKAGVCALDQDEPLGALHARLRPGAPGAAALGPPSADTAGEDPDA
ncbi:segregation and condensation protein A [Brevibacterium rongguiense]|uniref:segregation and condensation protein A n=1 Tax=Brevibacterium rongguiense TaxID=2695267 RepID=UPI002E294E02|nr:ScpA family protein [Brevibacterium rongguiense]